MNLQKIGNPSLFKALFPFGFPPFLKKEKKKIPLLAKFLNINPPPFVKEVEKISNYADIIQT